MYISYSGDHISSDITWTLDKSPYYVIGDVFVKATLTIEPGVEVRFIAQNDDRKSGYNSNLSELRILGTLKAIGTPHKRIVFTSAASSPAAGDWYGLVLEGGRSDIVQYCDIKYSETGIFLIYI